MSRHHAVEVTVEQAWFLANQLHAGAFPWKLAITAAYVEPGHGRDFTDRCTQELSDRGIIDDQGVVHSVVAACIRAVCRSHQWLEWLTILDPDQILRGVLARDSSGAAVCALRYAQMLALTPLSVDYSEALVPILTTGLDEQAPAVFDEFSLPMDRGVLLDKRIAAGADITSALEELGIDGRTAEIMAAARSGERSFTEITAHEATNGSRHQTDVSVNVINTEVGRILVSPPDGEPRQGGQSVFAPGDPFAIAMALRELTARLPSGTWFPHESFSI